MLNELLYLDYDFIHNLISTRVTCNKAVADHPTVQVQQFDNDKPKAGLLGLLNGLFGVNLAGRGFIQMDMDGTKILKFKSERF